MFITNIYFNDWWNFDVNAIWNEKITFLYLCMYHKCINEYLNFNIIIFKIIFNDIIFVKINIIKSN
jgi:hypothetical protein